MKNGLTGTGLRCDMTDTLAPRTLDLDWCKIGPTGMTVLATPTFESWAGIGELLRTFDIGIAWAVGDWLNTGEAVFGDKAAQVIDHKAWSESTVTVYRWVAKSVLPENRRADLSHGHHMIVADLPANEQREWLERAAEGTSGQQWSAPRLKTEMAASSSNMGRLAYLLVTECDDEPQRERLAARLESEGFTCKRSEAARKRPKKAGPVTARARNPQ